MTGTEKVNILLVDDQPSKLLSYEVVLRELGENLIKAESAREALEQLLKNDIAVILIDVCMPDLDGFQLASMIREHPRFQRTAIIFVSAVLMNEVDFLRGYEMGAVDYVPVPVIPDVLRAKVRVFAELFRKTRQLEQLNVELERRVRERTAELESSTGRLLQSEQRRNLALAAGNMGSWDWDLVNGDCLWDEGQHRIFGVDPASFALTLENVRTLIHPEDWERLVQAAKSLPSEDQSHQTEFRVCRPDGELRWCIGTATVTVASDGRILRASGVTVDITERKRTEERQNLLAREVDHRAKNALAVVQSIVRLTKSETIGNYVSAVDGRIRALARAHTLLAQSRWEGADLAALIDEELAPYRTGDAERMMFAGPRVSLEPRTAQTLALAIHELATNAAKYGALSSKQGRIALTWQVQDGTLALTWSETGGPAVQAPTARGFGIKVITSSIEAQLGGKTHFDWLPNGANFRLTIPHTGHGRVDTERAPRGRRPANEGVAVMPANCPRGNRVMIVEDEAMIGMMMKEMISELGYSPAGPFNTLAGALRAAQEDDVDFAILDVNLAGEWVYPVADVLTRREIPFIFITGYGADSLDRRFAQTPVYEKPVEAKMLESIFAGPPASPIVRPSFDNSAGDGRTHPPSVAHG